ncbi:MAG: thioredoxin TrxC [Gemmatimonadota bacterium]|nr:thioredoxin TrxC [Gemmatimonadota bacterium]
MHATVRCPFCLTLNRVDVSRARDRPRCGSCSRPVLLDRPVKVTDEDFDRLIGDAEVPVLVDFYADWCGPCKIMAPALDDLARERQGTMLIAKLDTDANPKTSQRFGIRGIPTVIVFDGGEEAGRLTGAVPAASLAELVDGTTKRDGELS